MTDEMRELLGYRLNRAKETLELACELYNREKYRDANNRSYYAAFYAMKAVFTTKGKDHKKHKTILADFNKEFIATEIFPKSIGRKISALALVREQSDYDDFFIASKVECEQQLQTAGEIIELVEKYLIENGYLTV